MAARATVHAAKEIASAVEVSFGPLGLDQLITTKLGGLRICSSGWALLQERETPRDKPLERLIQRTLNAQEAFGDGVSGLCLMLHQALQTLEGRDPRPLLPGFASLRDVAEEIREDLERISQPSTELPNLAYVQVAAQLVKCSISGQFTPVVEANLTTFVAQWLEQGLALNEGKLTRPAVVGYLCNRAESALVDVASAKDARFSVVPADAVLLDGPFLHRVKARAAPQKNNREGNSGFSFVVLNFPVVPVINDVNTRVHIESAEHLGHAVSYSNTRAVEVFSYLKEHIPDLGLIVSLFELADPSLECLDRIAAVGVQNVSRAQASALCLSAGIKSIDNINDLVQSPLEYVGHATAISEVSLGSKAFATLLEGIQLPEYALVTTKSIVRVPQGLIFGPSPGICKQYRAALIRVLRLLGEWALDKTSQGAVISAGGVAELTMARTLRQKSLSALDPSHQVAIEVLREALLAPVFALLKNGRPHWNTIDVFSWLANIEQGHMHGVALSSDGFRCEPVLEPRTVRSKEALEPLCLKLKQLSSLILTVNQLLRVDAVLFSHSKTLK